MNITAMKQALEALERIEHPDQSDVIEVLRQAIAEAEKQEPDKYVMEIECTKCGAKQSGVLTVHTHPQPKREPLTNEQIGVIWRDIDGSEGMLMRFARAIEVAHGIKENT